MDLIKGLTFAVCLSLMFFSRFALFGLLKQKGIRLNFTLATTPLYVESQYFTHRREIGSRRLDFLALVVLVSPFVALASFLWLVRAF